jgi:hypothetical protein
MTDAYWAEWGEEDDDEVNAYGTPKERPASRHCQHCGDSTRQLDVVQVTYERLGRELGPFPLVLCARCRALEQADANALFLLQKLASIGVSPKAIDEIVRRSPADVQALVRAFRRQTTEPP